jgi:hypothetical protein
LPSLDLLSLAIDGPPDGTAASPIKDETTGVSTTDLPGTIGPGPDLSLAAVLLLTQLNYHRLCCGWIRDPSSSTSAE